MKVCNRKERKMKHISNELTHYTIEGLLNESDYPMYIRIEEIAAVVQRAERKDEEQG